VVGAELLLRWQHPQRGLLGPGEFIAAAERSGAILAIGDWVLEEGCKTVVRLARAGRPLPLSLNVSPRQFRQPDFVPRLRDLLAATGADPRQLILEVTENLLIDDVAQAAARMRELAELGIRFAIDDFGTGFSSLAYLKRLPLAQLKIDRGFIQDTPQDGNDCAIVRLIISMAGSLGLKVVAEGVENVEQAAFLRGSGCDLQQGYLYARPVPLDAWLAALGVPVEPGRRERVAAAG
jgi:EAL domain-containing protein (putative c-di-GMP-specific phosphodiesterase class I)